MKVREAAAKLLSSCAENYFSILLFSKTLLNDLNIIINHLQDSYEISKNLSWFIVFMSEDMKSNPDNAM